MRETLTSKGFSRIYVVDQKAVELVKAIIKEMDEYEFVYLPKDLIAPFSEYPKVVYTHKFDDLNIHHLTARCWSKGIHIWVFDAQHEEWPSDPDWIKWKKSQGDEGDEANEWK